MRPLVHFRRHLFGDAQEERVAMDGELEVPLVVERHRRHLTERVLAVEHPAVGARQKGVRDVAKAAVHWRVRPGGRTRALNPLALQVLGDLAADEVAVTGVLNRDLRAGDHGLRIEEADPLSRARPFGPARGAGRHQRLSVGVERGERCQCGHGLPREDILIGRFKTRSNLQHRAPSGNSKCKVKVQNSSRSRATSSEAQRLCSDCA